MALAVETVKLPVAVVQYRLLADPISVAAAALYGHSMIKLDVAIASFVMTFEAAASIVNVSVTLGDKFCKASTN